MDVAFERVGMRWDCPLPDADLPRGQVAKALVSVAHTADDALSAAAAALEPVAGRGRRDLFGRRLVFHMRDHRLEVRAHDGRLEIRSQQRLSPRTLKRLVAALSTVPGASGLELHADVPRFGKPYSGLRACSPCQAKRF